MERTPKTSSTRHALKAAAILLSASPLLGAGTAKAQALLPSTPTAALHLGKHGLDVLGALALQQVPTHFDVPNVDKDLISCPIGDPISLHVSQAYLDLSPTSLTFTPADGAVTINTLLDLSGFAHIEVTKGYACIGTASCDISFAASGLAPTAALDLQITDGIPKSDIGQVSVEANSLHIDFSNCVLDGLNGGVTDAIAEKLLDMSQGLIGDKLRAALPPLLDAKLGSMLTKSGSFSGYGFNAAVSALNMTPDGIDAYAQVGVAYDGQRAVCMPASSAAPTTAVRNPTPSDGQLEFPGGKQASVVLGVGTDLLSDAVTSAWQAGMMCTDDNAVKALGFNPSNLVALIPGLPAGTSLGFTLGVNSNPTIATDKNGAITMHVAGMQLILTVGSPGTDTSDITVTTDFTVAVTPSIDAMSGTIYASLDNLSIERLEMDAGTSGSTYSIDPERLSVLMRDLVVPMASARLKGMPLSPAAFGAAGMYAWLSALDTNAGGIYVGLEPFVPGPASSDVEAPQTVMQQTPGKLVRAGMARYQVSGTDDTTPYQLLRYEWQVDDQPAQAPTFAKVISAPVTTTGSHTFRVRAVDLFDKPASTWLEHTFELDAVAPTLDVTDQPDVALRSSSARFSLAGTDDRSAPNLLSYGYRVETRAPGGDMKFVSGADPTGMEADGTGTFTVDNLVAGNTYQVTILLYDEAGNVTSKKIGFGAASTSGCSMAATPNASSVFTMLLIAAAIFVSTRRRVLVSR